MPLMFKVTTEDGRELIINLALVYWIDPASREVYMQGTTLPIDQKSLNLLYERGYIPA